LDEKAISFVKPPEFSVGDPNSYLKACDFCGRLIRMAVVPNGTWQPFDLSGDQRHDCSSPTESSTARHWRLSELNHRLTCRIDCWWCEDEVFFHTNGNGDCVLFDRLGWPWPVHDCWAENSDEHDAAADRMEATLRDRGYDGRGELIGLRPSEVPGSIPTQGRRNPPKLRIELQADDVHIIDSATKRLVMKLSRRGCRPVARPQPPEKQTDQDDFEHRTHRRAIEIWAATNDLLASLTKLPLPEAVEISIRQA
jgi:ribosomal protein S10